MGGQIDNLLEEKKSSAFGEFFRPSFFKLFLPVLILILIMISFAVNTSNASEIGDYFCKGAQDEEFFRDKNKEMVKGPLRNIALGNIYFFFSYTHKLNPFFPMPCESVEWSGFGNGESCRYYISEENYLCLKNSNKEINFSNILSGAPEYKKISFWRLLFHGSIIFFEIYLIIGIISIVRLKISGQSDEVVAGIYASLVVFSLIALYVFRIPYFIPVLILSIILMILQFIKNDKIIKIILSLFFAILSIALVVGLIVINHLISIS